MCEDQGMAIVSWASLGGGQLVSAEQRKKLENDPNAGKGYYSASEDDIKVCDVLERLAKKKNATLQDIVSTLPFMQSCHRSTTYYPSGTSISLPSIHTRIPNRWRTDHRTRQAIAGCNERIPFQRRD